ncbi:MAG: hypothetical protein ACREUU_13400 [Gammaproteobacteria bacterium]
MRAIEFLTCLLDAWGGSIPGRTLLHKRAYFVQDCAGVPDEIEFVSHFYGPYSPELDVAIGDAKAFAFLDERLLGFRATHVDGFERRRYEFYLTEDGREFTDHVKKSRLAEYSRIVGAAARIREAGDPDYFQLSIAAKVHFVLKKEGSPMAAYQVRSVAQALQWNISPENLEGAVAFLERLAPVRNVRSVEARA